MWDAERDQIDARAEGAREVRQQVASIRYSRPVVSKSRLFGDSLGP